MYNVMIVDDEPLVRHDLRMLLDWERHGFALSGEAANGVSAMELLRECRPHIAIIDMHMPGMDGLQLCKQIASEYPEIRIIVLSSYDHYDYVRETLKNGAVDYLLKHRMNAEHLLEVLTRIADGLAAERRNRNEEARRLATWSQLQLSAARHDLQEMLLGVQERDEAALSGLNEYFSAHVGPSPRIVVAALQIVNYLLIADAQTELEKSRVMHTIVDLCQQTVGEPACGIAAYVDEGTFVVLLALPEVMRSELQVGGVVSGLLQRMEHSVRLATNLRVCSGSAPVMMSMREVGVGYERACAALRKSSGLMAFVPERQEMPNVSAWGLTIQQEKELLAAVDQRNADYAERIVRGILAGLSKDAPQGAAPHLVRELLALAGKVARRLGLPPIRLTEEAARFASEPVQDSDWEQLTQWIALVYTDLLRQLGGDPEEDSYSVHVRNAIRFASEQYRQPISLEAAAEQAGISSSYLSRIFREETGVPFTEYVNKVRIQKAMQMMDAGDRKIKEIYEKVGFTGYNYFFKVFKMTAGVTPKEYLKLKGK
jgi:two-component system response regulator YesN